MKLLFSYLILSLICLNIQAQTFNFSLSGNPVNTTGWTLSNLSAVNNDEIILAKPINSQAGFIFYNTPQNLANCSQFTVSFDFRITNSSNPTADGIAFFYISNPPSGFTLGSGIGLPTNPNGLLMILDTYDNDQNQNNPLISVRKLNGTSNYLEGSTTGLISPDITNQNFISDGNWHHCEIAYSFGTVTVSFDNNLPILTGNTTLSINGYFGFSSSTGAYWATHSIKNVAIQGAVEPNPPKTDTVFYCQFETPRQLVVNGENIHWYENSSGGSPMPTAPTPNTNQAGTYIWYVSTEIPECNLESKRAPLVVVIEAKPSPPIIEVPVYCNGFTAIPLKVTSGQNLKWYTQASGGVSSSSQPVINTLKPDSFTYFVSQSSSLGCESERKKVSILIHQTPKAIFDFDLAYNCNGVDTLLFKNNSMYADRYKWDFDDGTSKTDFQPTHNFSEGAYMIQLTASNAFCSDSITRIINIGHPLIAEFTTSQDTICVGMEVEFYNSSIADSINGIAPLYLWIFGDDFSQTNEKLPKHVFNKSGQHKVTLIVQNGIPCFDTFSKIIVVDPAPYLFLTSSDSVFCKGDKILLNAHIEEGGLKELIWHFDDSDTWLFNHRSVQHAFENASNYTISLKADYRICPDTLRTLKVRVYDIPMIDLGPDTSICLNGSAIKIEDAHNKNNPKAKWLWNTGDTTSFLNIKHDGIYYTIVTIDGCMNKEEVVVQKDCYIDIPNSFTPDGDGHNDYFLPRQLLSKGLNSFKMVIYNRWGQVLFEANSVNGRGWDGKFNEKSQPLGVYIYQIEAELKSGKREKYTGNVTLIR